MSEAQQDVCQQQVEMEISSRLCSPMEHFLTLQVLQVHTRVLVVRVLAACSLHWNLAQLQQVQALVSDCKEAGRCLQPGLRRAGACAKLNVAG
jgi:hypothetical protein